jgi:hypothetical protein
VFAWSGSCCSILKRLRVTTRVAAEFSRTIFPALPRSAMAKNPPSWLKSFAKRKAKPSENDDTLSFSASSVPSFASPDATDVEAHPVAQDDAEDYMSNALIPELPSHRSKRPTEDPAPRCVQIVYETATAQAQSLTFRPLSWTQPTEVFKAYHDRGTSWRTQPTNRK